MEEPWLRGPIAGVHAMLAPVLYTFQQAREDLARHTAGMTDDQLWTVPHDGGSVGFHLRHMAGSTDRLMTYLQGLELGEEQMAALEAEGQADGAGRVELLAELDGAFGRAEAIVGGLDPATLAERRTVGRKHLPTTVIGLLTHIAEHIQRHIGATIVLARAVRGSRASAVQ
jgi:uncharacterized damage-inducible protein DinB